MDAIEAVAEAWACLDRNPYEDAYESYRAAARELIRRIAHRGYVVVPGDEWQPIETAPRDGTRVLLGFTDDSYDDYEGVTWGCYVDDEWRDHEGFHCSLPPSHWMPLPKRPLTAA